MQTHIFIYEFPKRMVLQLTTDKNPLRYITFTKEDNNNNNNNLHSVKGTITYIWQLRQNNKTNSHCKIKQKNYAELPEWINKWLTYTVSKLLDHLSVAESLRILSTKNDVTVILI